MYNYSFKCIFIHLKVREKKTKKHTHYKNNCIRISIYGYQKKGVKNDSPKKTRRHRL